MKEFSDAKVEDNVGWGNVMHQAGTTRNNEIDDRDLQPDNRASFLRRDNGLLCQKTPQLGITFQLSTALTFNPTTLPPSLSNPTI